MPKAARKMVFTEEPLNPDDELLTLASRPTVPKAATPDPTPAVPPGTNPPPGHPDYHPPRNPPPYRDDPRPRPGDADPYRTPSSPDENTGDEGDDIANPDVPGSTPTPRDIKPRTTPENPTGDPTPDPDPTSPDIEKGEDDGPQPPASRAALPDPAGSPASAALTGEILPRNSRYESRITILDAFHYPGSFREAPDWVDRNWLGYADDDPVRGIVAGPALRVPTHNRHGDVVLARVGDYVTRQEVRLAPDVPGDIRVEVWAKEQFEKMFLPVSR